MSRPHPRFLSLAILFALGLPLAAQDQSVRPGINKPYEKPDVERMAQAWEGESREIFARRKDILDVCKLEPGMAVADVGAGTGLFTRLFAQAVGEKGKVYAVDISDEFIAHIDKTCREQGIGNVTTILCTADSSGLPANSVDLVYICDVYHHFEYPFKTMATIHAALRPGGRLVVIDFHRIEGKSPQWIIDHVRAGQEVFRKEIESAGFKLIAEAEILTENYCMVFQRVEVK